MLLFPSTLLIPIGASIALYFYFARLSNLGMLWRSAAAVALVVTTARVGGTCLGRYWLEATSGSLQLLGYFMALWSLPEVLLTPGLLKQHGTRPLVQLSILLLGGTTAWVSSIAYVALRSRGRLPSA